MLPAYDEKGLMVPPCKEALAERPNKSSDTSLGDHVSEVGPEVTELEGVNWDIAVLRLTSP